MKTNLFHCLNKILFLHLVVDFIKPVKRMEVWGVRNPGIFIGIDLDDAGYIFRRHLQNCLLECLIANILNKKIGNEQFDMWQLVILGNHINQQALQRSGKFGIPVFCCGQVFFVNVNTVYLCIFLFIHMLQPVSACNA